MAGSLWISLYNILIYIDEYFVSPLKMAYIVLIQTVEADMWVWVVLRCLFEVLLGASGLARTFTGCRGMCGIFKALLDFNDDERIVVVVLAALIIGGIFEIALTLNEVLKKAS
jgi:hypothetical protein